MRTRGHILEEESRQAFQNAIPAEWVMRPHDPDYGVDREVQVFRNGVATGYFFFVQLKGHDGMSAAAGTASHSYRTDRLRQYLDSPIPMMLVLYDASNRRLYYEWLHDVYRDLSSDEKRKWHLQKTTTIKLSRRLDMTDWRVVERDVRHGSFQLGKRPEAHEDFTVKLVVEGASVVGLMEMMRRHTGANPLCQSIRIVEEGVTDGVVVIVPEHASILLGCGQRAFDYLEYSGELDDTNVGFLITFVFGIALILAEAGRAGHAVDLIGSLFMGTDDMPDAAEGLCRHPPLPMIYAAAGRTGDALALAEAACKMGWPHSAVMLASSALHDQSYYGNSYRRILKQAIKLTGDTAATLQYNLANSLRFHGYHREAIQHYHRAAQIDRDYSLRPYWWRELGGCLFLGGHFAWAEKCYRNALEYEEDQQRLSATHGLLADTLLYQGRFAQASEEFRTCMATLKQPDAETLLKSSLTDFLVGHFGDDVTRDTAAATQITKDAGSLEPVPRRAALTEALKADPLCGFAWFNYAGCHPRDSAEPRYIEWLVTATMQDWDVEAWAYAILSMFSDELASREGCRDAPDSLCAVQPDILSASMYRAYHLHGPLLEIEMDRIVQTTQPGFEGRDDLIGRIVSIARNMDPIYSRSTSPEMRALHSHGDDLSCQS